MGRAISDVLNRESATITADHPTLNDDLDTATGVPTLQEATQAIQQKVRNDTWN